MSGDEATLRVAPFKLLAEVNGRPREFRFRSRDDDGAEVGGGNGEGVEGIALSGCASSKAVRYNVFLLLGFGRAAFECCGWPKANPTAAMPTVPVAQSCSKPYVLANISQTRASHL